MGRLLATYRPYLVLVAYDQLRQAFHCKVSPSDVVQKTLHDAVAHKDVVEVKGSLSTARRFIHVQDICSGILAAVAKAPEGFAVFNLSGDRLISLGDVIDEAMRLTGRRPRVLERAPAAVNIRNPDNTAARASLGWMPKLDLAAGLATLEPALCS